MSYRLRLSAAAERDLLGILRWSQAQFGPSARRRYEALIQAALRGLAGAPTAPGSRQRPEIGTGVRSWHLRLSRDKAVVDGEVVRRPRHFILYRVEGDTVLVGRILHDSMDFAGQDDRDVDDA